MPSQDQAALSLRQALAAGCFSHPSILSDKVEHAINAGRVADGLVLVERAAAHVDQSPLFWVHMEMASQRLGLNELATRFRSRYANPSRSRIFEVVGEIVESQVSIVDGMAMIIDFCSETQPHEDWALFRQLDPRDEFGQLGAWLERVFTEDGPAAAITGLWFGLSNPIRAGKPTLDVYVAGGHAQDDSEDWLYRLSWRPRAAWAHSRYLEAIYRRAHSSESRRPLGNDAEYPLALTYAGFLVQSFARRFPELLLEPAPRRVLVAGFDEGDWLTVGTIMPEGLTAPGR